MREIILFYWQMCLLRDGPERLPRTTFVLATTFVLYVVTALTINLISRNDIGIAKATAFVMIGLAVEIGIVGALLLFKSVPDRLQQTLTALFGANTLILLLTLPILLLMAQLESATLTLVLESVFLGIFVWWLTIAGHILHRAADISLALGIATAFGIELLAIATTYAIFPLQTTPG